MRRFLTFCCLLGAALAAHAEEKPLWEAGFGVSELVFPAYRGSDRYYAYTLPLPYLIYRGDRLRLDRGGLRGLLFDSERVTVDLSLNGAVPVRSDDIPARAGMPNLDPVFESGPSLNIALTEPDAAAPWQLKLPFRGVLAIGSGVDHVGWSFHPKLSLYLPATLGGWSAGFNVGPLFADRRFHDYYYGVAPRFASVNRPAYEGEAGYSGTSLTLSFSRRFENYWIGIFTRYDNLSGASFEDSPLVDSEHALMAGVGIAWIFKRSKRLVNVLEE
jgi:outer membrane protein